MAELITSLETKPEAPKNNISFGFTPVPQKDPSVLASRANKADFALGEASPGAEVVQGAYALGFEDQIRETARVAEAADLRRQKTQMVSDLANQAAREGRSLTPEEADDIYRLSKDEMLDPKTALEKRYARRLVEERKASEESVKAQEEDPELVRQADTKTRDILTKQQIAQRIFENTRQRYEDQSWASWGVDFVKEAVPFYTWWKIKDRVSETGADSLMTGSNLGEQIVGLYQMSDEDFEQKLTEAVESLSQDNLSTAVQFAQAAVAFSNSDRLLGNLFTALDTTDVALLGAGKIVKAGARALAKRGEREAAEQYAARSAALIEESANPKMTPVDKKVVNGDIDSAILEGVQTKLKKANAGDAPSATGKTAPQKNSVELDDLLHSQPGLFDPKNYLRTASSLTEEAQRRTMDDLLENSKILKISDSDITHVVRISDEAAAVAFREAEARFRSTYSNLEDLIVDVIPNRTSVEVFGGVDNIDIILGKKGAKPFASVSQAENYAQNYIKLPVGGYEIRQYKGNPMIFVNRTVDETSTEVLSARIGTDNQTPVNFVNTWIGMLRNPDDVLSLEHRQVRKQATYGAGHMLEKMGLVAKQIGKLSKNESDRLWQIIDEAKLKHRTVIDPATNQSVRVPGMFYQTAADVEMAYMKKFKRLPTAKELQGYAAFRQLMDHDFLLRNASVYRDKARLGVNQKSVGWLLETEGGKSYQKTPFFEARQIDSLPSRSGSPFTLAWFNHKTGKVDFALSSQIGARFPKKIGGVKMRGWEEIDDLLAQDYKIIQVANPRDEALSKAVKSGGEPVQYMIVRDIDEKPLSPHQVPYNEGGHWIYPQTGQYLKQAQVHDTRFGRKVYSGDVTAHYFLSGGEKHQKAYETLRQMIRDNDPNLDAFAQRNTPYTGAEAKKLFRSKSNPDAPFSLDTPFVLTRSGQSTKDVMDLRNLFDQEVVDVAGSEHSLLSRMNTQYAQERGERLTSIRNEGTEANPIFKLTGAPVMDAMNMLKRSSAELAKSRYFEDLKHRVIEDHMTQFKDVFDVPEQELLSNPMKYLRDGPYKKKYADAPKMAAAKNARRAILQLLGEDRPEIARWKYTRQKMVDSLFQAEAALGKDMTVLDPWKWDSRTDPATMTRSAVFHTKLGLFNVAQFPKQASAIAHAAAIDGNPIRAVQANLLYWILRQRRLAPSHGQGAFTKAASRALGLDPKAVEEIADAWNASGMRNLNGSYGMLDDFLNPDTLFDATGVSKALDAGQIFFREGNNWHAGTSFITAFMRWRAENPLKKLDAQEMAKISERADLMFINMSRASNNDILQGGAASVPTQFFAYQVRMAEQMLSKRLTWQEKARIMTLYSALFGIPVGVAGTTVGAFWPVHDSIRQHLLEQGVDLEGDRVAQFLTEGAVNMAMGILGEGGNFDTSAYGPGGLDWAQNLFEGKFLEVIGGAAGSFLSKNLELMAPFVFRSEAVFAEDDSQFPLKMEDFLDVAREMSSMNSAAKAWFAYNTGLYMTTGDKTGVDLGKVTEKEALLMGVLGLTPQELSDGYLMMRSNKQDDERKKSFSDLAVTQFIRGVKYAAEGDRKNAEAYYTRARTILKGAGFSGSEMATVRDRAMKQIAPVMNKVSKDFMLRDPENRREQYYNKIDRAD